jgi:hypothetical protein
MALMDAILRKIQGPFLQLVELVLTALWDRYHPYFLINLRTNQHLLGMNPFHRAPHDLILAD